MAETATLNILIVDDDADLTVVLVKYLTSNGYAVQTAGGGAEMRAALAVTTPDLILLDLVLPDATGFDLAKEIRKTSEVPIIMLTGQGSEMVTVAGLELGADDFVGKPFSLHELRARIAAVLKRSTAFSNQGAGPYSQRSMGPRFGEFGGWKIDVSARKLHNPDGERVVLTTDEFDLLYALLERRNQVMSREQLLDHLRKDVASSFDRAIDTKITRLRKKIEKDPKKPEFIKTIRNVGYTFDHQIEWN